MDLSDIPMIHLFSTFMLRVLFEKHLRSQVPLQKSRNDMSIQHDIFRGRFRWSSNHGYFILEYIYKCVVVMQISPK